MNTHGTDGDSLTVVLPEPLTNFIELTRRALMFTRTKHGADTPIGHRCSNIIEGLESGAPPTLIARQMADLDKLLNGPQ